VQTIRGIGDGAAFDATVEDAFPGSAVESTIAGDGYFELEMRQRRLSRALKAAELPDGTLRVLMLAAALLWPRSPTLMVLNEPETRLHDSLIAPLARLILPAAQATQIAAVSHAASLVSILSEAEQTSRIVLKKHFAETIAKDVESPPWRWPDRSLALLARTAYSPFSTSVN